MLERMYTGYRRRILLLIGLDELEEFDLIKCDKFPPERLKKLSRLVGEVIARGYANEDIVDFLIKGEGFIKSLVTLSPSDVNDLSEDPAGLLAALGAGGDVSFEPLTPDEAMMFLRAVYASWEILDQKLQVDTTTQRQWHIKVREQIVKDAMTSMDSKDRGLALRTLDSLAELQGVMEVADPGRHEILSIQLIPKQVEQVEQEQEQEDNK